MIPRDVADFLDRSISSLWALEMLLLMRAHSRPWTSSDLVKELRASESIVQRELPLLARAGLVNEVERGHFQYLAATSEIEGRVEQVAQYYKEFPVAVVRHVALSPHREWQEFADAFKFKKE